MCLGLNSISFNCSIANPFLYDSLYDCTLLTEVRKPHNCIGTPTGAQRHDRNIPDTDHETEHSDRPGQDCNKDLIPVHHRLVDPHWPEYKGHGPIGSGMLWAHTGDRNSECRLHYQRNDAIRIN